MYNRAEPKKKRMGFLTGLSGGDSDEEEELGRGNGLSQRNLNYREVNPLQYHNASATAAMEINNSNNLSPEKLAAARERGKAAYASTIKSEAVIANQQLLTEQLSKQYQAGNEMLADLLNYSNMKIKGLELPIIPAYIHNIVRTNVWGEKIVKGLDSSNVSSFQWAPHDAQMAFGSYKEYCQLYDPPPVYTENDEMVKMGNLKNCYVFDMNFEYINNNLPCAVGVTLKYGSETKGATFLDRNSYAEGKLFHAVIPPGNHKNVQVYLSNVFINSEYGELYPKYTLYNYRTKGVEHYGGSSIGFSPDHPCVSYLFQYCEINSLPKPQRGTGVTTGHITVDKHVAEHGLDHIGKILQTKVPIIDLSKFYIHFTPLMSGEIGETITGKESTANISFNLRSTHAFKDIVPEEESGNRVYHKQIDTRQPKQDVYQTMKPDFNQNLPKFTF